jgi:hypothetical protein
MARISSIDQNDCEISFNVLDDDTHLSSELIERILLIPLV